MDESTPSLDSMWNQVGAEFAPLDVAPSTADDAPAPTPTGEGEQVSSGTATETATATQQTDGADSAPAAPTPKKAEPTKPAGESEAEARVRKLENDLALAKKGQAAADRRANALEQARQLEASRTQQLAQQGLLTHEEVAAAPQRMEAWVQHVEAEAAQAEATAERQRVAAESQARDIEREATLAFKEQALPLVNDMMALGLAPDDADHEMLLQTILESEKYAADVALTWKLEHDPPEAARVYERLMSAAKADVKQELTKIAAAKKETEAKKAGRTQFDRTSSPGPSTGGADPIPDMPLDDMWGRIEWKT